MQFLLFAIALGAIVYVVILTKRGRWDGDTDSGADGANGNIWDSCDSDGGGDGGGGD